MSVAISEFFSESKMDSETRLLCKILDQESALTNHDCSGIDWDHFLAVLKSHRISNTVHIDGRILPYLPAKIKIQLQEKYRVSQYRMLSYIAELHNLISLFEQNAIASVALKGPTLGQKYYGTPTQRESKDLDILIKPSDFQKALEILIKEGYMVSGTSWGSPMQQEVYMENFHHYSLYHPTRFIQLELHWKLYSSKSMNANKMEHLWKNLVFQKVVSLDIPVLSEKDTFIFLCVHGGAYAHQWKRLFWVQDIAYIIRKEGQLFVEDCYQLSIHQGVQRYVLEACLLAHSIFKVELPALLHVAIKNDQQVSALYRISFHAIINATHSDLSMLPAWPSLRSGLMTFRRIYLLDGIKAPFMVLRRIFIHPEGWQIFSFSDRFFALNYFVAPFLRFYSTFIK